jgi:hypothetical protein
MTQTKDFLQDYNWIQMRFKSRATATYSIAQPRIHKRKIQLSENNLRNDLFEEMEFSK